jgi:chromosome segregation ATPase
LAYFQKQKEAAEREVTELKEELQSKAEELELQQGANDEQTEMIEDLTFKLQALEAKYDKSREEL